VAAAPPWTILPAVEDPVVDPGARPPAGPGRDAGAVLEAEQVSLSLGGVAVLRGVDLALRAGELLAVVGPNGAGKTSLVRVLCGVCAPQQGRVRLRGELLEALPRRAVARALAVVPQELGSAFPYRVRELVAMGRAPHLGPLGRDGPADRALVAQALAELELEPLAERRFPALSAGEKQRVALARARAQDTPILLLDEPTAHMDLGHALRCFEWVREWVRGARAALLVSHDLGLAARFADRALLLEGGRVLASGPPAQVFTPERIRSVYGVEARVSAGERGLEIVPLRYTPPSHGTRHTRAEPPR
jgi:iron complex transport system ATP-binding protein